MSLGSVEQSMKDSLGLSKILGDISFLLKLFY